MRPPSPLTLTLLGTVVFVLAMSTSYVAESQFLRNRAPVQARSSHGCASASRRATGKAFLHAIAGLAVTRGMSGEAGALNLPSLPAMPSMPALPALPVGGQAELKSIGKLQAKDGSWEVMIGEGFEEEGKSLINSLSGNHIEQHKFTSTIKPKFSVLVSEDPLPLDVKIPSLDDVAERSIEIEKAKAYVDDVELLDADSKLINGVDVRYISYRVTTARDEDRYFSKSACKDGKLFTLQVRVRERDYERFENVVKGMLDSFKITA